MHVNMTHIMAVTQARGCGLFSPKGRVPRSKTGQPALLYLVDCIFACPREAGKSLVRNGTLQKGRISMQDRHELCKNTEFRVFPGTGLRIPECFSLIGSVE